MRHGIEHLLRAADVPDPERAEELWVEYRTGGGNADGAFATLLAWYGGPIYRRIWGFVRSDHADDVFQDVLARLHKERTRLTTFADALRWLRTVAVTHCIDVHRRAARRVARERARAVPAGAAGSSAPALELNDALRVLLAKLSAREQQAVALVFFEGLTRQDAAEAAGIHRRTFAKTLDGALARLRVGLAVALVTAAATTESLEAALAVRPAFVSNLRLAELAAGAWNKPVTGPPLGGWLAGKKLLSGVAAGLLTVSLVTWGLIMLNLQRLETRETPSAGALDTTFGTNGIFTVPYPVVAITPPADAAQPDGKIVTVQTTPLNANSNNYNPAVTRLNKDGSLDSTFGTNGTVTLPFGTSAYGMDVAVAPDGGILVAAKVYTKSSFFNGVSDSEYAVAKLTSSGALDTTFGNKQGWWVSNPSGNDEIVRKLSVVPTAGGGYSIIAAGTAGQADGSTAFAVAKLTSAGQPDTTFGTNGLTVRKVGSGLGGSNNLTLSSTVTTSGEIVMSGAVVGLTDGPVLVAFTPAGQVDTGFGTNGVATISLPGTYLGKPSNGGMVLAAQGTSVIVAGNTGYNIDPKGVVHVVGFVTRLSTAGVQDSTFGTNGVVYGPLPSTTLYGSTFNGVAVGTDGSIALEGHAWAQGADGSRQAGGLLLERLLVNGTADTGFGTDGTGAVIRYDLPSNPSGQYYQSLTLDSNGNLIVGLALSTSPAQRLVLRFTGS